MLFNEKDLRATDERRKDLRREADQERLAKESRRSERKTDKKSPLWTRVWVLFL